MTLVITDEAVLDSNCGAQEAVDVSVDASVLRDIEWSSDNEPLLTKMPLPTPVVVLNAIVLWLRVELPIMNSPPPVLAELPLIVLLMKDPAAIHATAAAAR